MEFVVGGFHPSPVDPRDYKIAYGVSEAKAKLPPVWTPDVNFSIHNQGKINSCVGHALCAQYEMKNNPAMAYGHIYGNRKYTDHMGQGLICRDALKTIQKDGVPTLKSYPYDAEVPEIIKLFEKHAGGVATEAMRYRIGNYYRLNTFEECKQAMYDGYGVVFGLYLFKGMIDMDKGTDPMVISPKIIDGVQLPPVIGGHLVSGFGWDSRGLRFANSWSAGWGEKGYGYITEDCFNWSAKNNFPIPLVEAWAFTFDATQIPPEEEKKDGWYKQNGKWRYRKNGTDLIGWVDDRGTWYYLDKNGYMATGWIMDKNKWYYMDTSGAMVKGWRKIKNYWYYLDLKTGEMVVGFKTIDGKKYLFNPGFVTSIPNGALIMTDKDGALMIY